MTNKHIMFQVENNYPIFFDNLEDLHLYAFESFPAVIHVYFSDESLANYIRDTIDNVYEYYRAKIKWMFTHVPEKHIISLVNEAIEEYNGGMEGSFAYEINKYRVEDLKPLYDCIKSQKPMPVEAQAVLEERFWDLAADTIARSNSE